MGLLKIINRSGNSTTYDATQIRALALQAAKDLGSTMKTWTIVVDERSRALSLVVTIVDANGNEATTGVAI